MAGELEELARIRAELDGISAERRTHTVAAGELRETLARFARQGTPKRVTAATQRRLDSTGTLIGQLDTREQQLRDRIERIRRRLRPNRPEDAVARLDGQVPVVLLPVRLETRFTDPDRELRIRIYPEQLHVDAHEPGLTEGERQLAEQYWSARWAASTAEDRAAAWQELTRRVRPARARYLVDASEPTNLATLGTGSPAFPEIPLRSGPFTRQATARLLPEQWVALGYRRGAEVFRAWSGPVVEDLAVGLPPDPAADADDPQPVPDQQDTLPLDDTIRWLVEYDAALTAGMAVTVTARDLRSGTLREGVDELVVLGVDWGADPEAAAASLDAQIGRHVYTDGLALLGPGVPTNNTDDTRSAPGTDPVADGSDLDPDTVRSAPAAAARLGGALGVDPDGGLGVVPARGSLDDTAAADMNNVLWAATMGAFLDQMMVPVIGSRGADDVHEHFRRHVRGLGPYPAVRIGRQPYGVLPVRAGQVATGDGVTDQVAARLAGLRPFWTQATGRVPRLGDSDRPDVDTLELLRRTPWSGTFRFREAFGGSVTSSITGFGMAAVMQEGLARLSLSLAGIPGRPRIAGITLDPRQRDVPVPLTTYGDLSETDPLDPDYVDAALRSATTSGGFVRLLNRPDQADTLLEALLRQSVMVEYAIGSTLLVIDHELRARVLEQRPEHQRVLESEVLGIEVRGIDVDVPGDDSGHDAGDAGDAGDSGSDAPASVFATAKDPVSIAQLSIQEVSGSSSLVNHLAAKTNAELLRRVTTRRFGAFRASLSRLVGLPTAELDRLAASTLDTVSHRLDAWETSVATRRLEAVRADRGNGSYVGGFGYVEDLRPSAAPVSRGYLHAPSVPHATTAAILRSGHLARGESPQGTLAVDLSSTRVRRALDLLEGMRRGQSIGALLGYRFERSVRDRRMTLVKYVLPMRQLTPIARASTGPDGDASVESIAARDVVDGVALLDAWRPDPNAYFGRLSAPVANTDRGDLNDLLRQLDDLFDACSDLLLAESVHQVVMGNPERSAAALDALDKQQPLPDLGVVRTPRTATGLSHRLLLLLGAAAPAPGWTVNDPRRKADPRIDAWCGAVLGRPGRFRFVAEVRDAEGTVVQTLAARLPALRLSALSTVLGCAAAGSGTSELEQRLALHFGAQVTAADAVEIVLLEDPPAGAGATALGLRDLLDLGSQVQELLASGRQADARTLLPDTERADAGVDLADLESRADAAVAALSAAVTGLEALTATSTPDDMADALLAAADAGAPGAVPGTEPLPEQVTRVALAGRRSLDALTAADAEFATTTHEDAAVAAHHLERIRTVMGQGFPAVARFALPGPVPDGEDFRASLAASSADPALLGDEGAAAVAGWLTMHAQVRPSAARLTGVLEGAEMLGGARGLADLHVAQLPHRPGSGWVGRRFDTPPPPTMSLVVHAAARPAYDQPLAGLVLDQWTEAVPSDTETTGLSFHFDAPGARAPQTVLIATPTDARVAHWSVDSLAGTVREAVALARIRGLDLDDVDAASRFLPAAYLPFNLESKVPSTNLGAIIATAIERHNTIFLEVDR